MPTFHVKHYTLRGIVFNKDRSNIAKVFQTKINDENSIQTWKFDSSKVLSACFILIYYISIFTLLDFATLDKIWNRQIGSLFIGNWL